MRRALLLLLLVAGLVQAEVSLPLVISGGTLACRGSIDGHRGLLLIDSGSSVTCLFPAQVAQHSYRFRKVRMTAHTAAGPQRIREVVRRARFVVGGITYRATDLVVLPDCNTEAIGLLGCDFLTATGARIDLARKRLILTRKP
jgi:hypothetical protein